MIYSNIQENGEIEILKFCLKIGSSFSQKIKINADNF